MDIRQLKYFIAIAEEGSFSAASLKLGVSQPSLSAHVTKVEQELGVALLTRSARGVVVTPPGATLLKHAREICNSMRECQQIVRETGHGPEGIVAVGVPSSVSMVLSVPLAETCRLELPKVRLRPIEAMSGFIETWLQDEAIDFGFLYEITDARNLEVHELVQEDLRFYGPPEDWPFKTAPGGPVRLADIARLELVLPSEHHALRRTIDRYAEAQGLSLNVVMEMDALAQIKELVVRGSGYTILAPAAAHDRVAHGELVSAPIIDPPMRRPVHIVRKLTKPQTYISREVLRLTIEVVNDLVKRGIWIVSSQARAAPFEDIVANLKLPEAEPLLAKSRADVVRV